MDSNDIVFRSFGELSGIVGFGFDCGFRFLDFYFSVVVVADFGFRGCFKVWDIVVLLGYVRIRNNLILLFEDENVVFFLGKKVYFWEIYELIGF